MNLAISNIAWLPEQRLDVYALMQKFGYTGLEIAPALFQRVSNAPYTQKQSVSDAAVAELEEFGLSVVSMQALHFGEEGMALFGSSAERHKLFDCTKLALDYAGKLGIRNLVFGSPKLRHVPEGMSPEQVEDISIPFFLELSQEALARGCVIGLEPNAKDYGTNFINTTEQALDLIKKVSCDGLMLNLDMGNLITNRTDTALLKDAIPYISHVHYSLPMLQIIKRENIDVFRRFDDILRAKVEKNVYFSIEMGRCELSFIEDALQLLADMRL